MSNQLVYRGCVTYTPKDPHEWAVACWSEWTKIYTKKGLAVNNTPCRHWNDDLHTDSEIIEYELVPTGRKFNSENGELIE